MWDPEDDSNYRVRWWLAMLSIPWLRALIFGGLAITFITLIGFPLTSAEGQPMSFDERVIQLLLLTFVTVLVLGIERRRRREERMMAIEEEHE